MLLVQNSVYRRSSAMAYHTTCMHSKGGQTEGSLSWRLAGFSSFFKQLEHRAAAYHKFQIQNWCNRQLMFSRALEIQDGGGGSDRRRGRGEALRRRRAWRDTAQPRQTKGCLFQVLGLELLCGASHCHRSRSPYRDTAGTTKARLQYATQ